MKNLPSPTFCNVRCYAAKISLNFEFGTTLAQITNTKMVITKDNKTEARQNLLYYEHWTDKLKYFDI